MQSQRPISRFAICIIGSLLSGPSPLAATDPPAPDSTSATPSAHVVQTTAKKPKVTCTTRTMTGSNINTRTCRSERQAAEQQRAAEEMLERESARRQNGFDPGGPGTSSGSGTP